MIRQPFAALRTVVRAATILGVLTGIAGAQGPKVFYACYVPTTGTVYRIKEPGTPAACGVSTDKGKPGGATQPHVEFSWTDGANGGSSDHGGLAGLTDDDHAQYLLADGVRNSTNGFAVNGNFSVGSIPASGQGTRMMWYPGKSALRAGTVWATEWDDAQVGMFSMALGTSPVASGEGSTAIGTGAIASGRYSVALGTANASGGGAFAAGNGSASALNAVAIGESAIASGMGSMALGTNANTNGKVGAFVWGDAAGHYAEALVDNQFVARASQFWLGSNSNVTATAGRFIETSSGAFLSTGGTWTNSSDSARKTAFADVDGEQVLAKLAAMPVATWTYREEDDSVRHMGPTAQDFRAAFALGSTDKAIATVDADGVSLAAIKALISRTAALQERVDRLEAELLRLAPARK